MAAAFDPDICSQIIIWLSDMNDILSLFRTSRRCYFERSLWRIALSSHLRKELSIDLASMDSVEMRRFVLRALSIQRNLTSLFPKPKSTRSIQIGESQFLIDVIDSGQKIIFTSLDCSGPQPLFKIKYWDLQLKREIGCLSFDKRPSHLLQTILPRDYAKSSAQDGKIIYALSCPHLDPSSGSLSPLNILVFQVVPGPVASISRLARLEVLHQNNTPVNFYGEDLNRLLITPGALYFISISFWDNSSVSLASVPLPISASQDGHHLQLKSWKHSVTIPHCRKRAFIREQTSNIIFLSNDDQLWESTISLENPPSTSTILVPQQLAIPILTSADLQHVWQAESHLYLLSYCRVVNIGEQLKFLELSRSRSTNDLSHPVLIGDLCNYFAGHSLATFSSSSPFLCCTLAVAKEQHEHTFDLLSFQPGVSRDIKVSKLEVPSSIAAEGTSTSQGTMFRFHMDFVEGILTFCPPDDDKVYQIYY